MQWSYIQNLSDLHHEEPEWFLLRCFGFFIVNLEHVYSWVAISTSGNDQVKAAGKEAKFVIYNTNVKPVCLCVATMLHFLLYIYISISIYLSMYIYYIYIYIIYIYNINIYKHIYIYIYMYIYIYIIYMYCISNKIYIHVQ